MVTKEEHLNDTVMTSDAHQVIGPVVGHHYHYYYYYMNHQSISL